ncbi:hypothetical protein DFP73DRAFT_487785, partial [Morchella snyderi]
AVINDCTVPGTIALTFDDGPDQYTSYVLDVLESYGAKATFFITGNNNGKGAIDGSSQWTSIIQRQYGSGHQIASHTWDHLDLSTLAEDDRRRQMTRLEEALRTIIGVTPAYMRPPYSSCGSACVATLQDLSYHIVYFDLDTDDYNNDSPSLIVNAQNRYKSALDGGNSASSSFLSIAHDIHEQTAHTLTKYMLEYGASKGYRFVTLGECLGDAQANWYK